MRLRSPSACVANDSQTRRRCLVLHVLPQDLNRGAQAYAGRLRDSLSGDEEQEHLVVTLFAGEQGAARPDVPLDVRPGTARRLVDPRAVWRLRALIRQRGADVVVAHGGEALKYVVAAASGRPTIYYKVGLSTSELQRPLHRMLYRFLSRRVCRVVGNSRAILEQVSAVFGIPTGHQALIPNGRDPSIYRPLIDGEKPANPPRILFVGQLEPGKRPDLFIGAVEVLRRKGLVFDALIAGDGPLRAALAPRALATGIQLRGTRSDVPELMRHSAVLVMTSAPDTEGMPGVLIEAGLSGIPAVATEAAGVTDIIDDGRTGTIVCGSQPERVAMEIDQLLGDAIRRRELGAAARAKCLRQFSVRATADLWRRLVAELLTQALRGNECECQEAGKI